MTNEHPVTVLGLGRMGAALAAAFVRAGHPTTTWTRSGAVGPEGTTRAPSVADALAAGPLVVVCVLDHAAVLDVLTGHDLRGRTVLDLTTTTPEQARDTAALVRGQGGTHLDGGIMNPPSVVGSADALVFYSGPAESFADHAATLRALGRAEHLGADPGFASLHDTALLGMMYSTLIGFFHAAALVGHEGVRAREFLPMAANWLTAVASFLPGLAEQIDTGVYAGGEATIAMQAHAAGHLVDVGRSRGLDGTLLEHVRDLLVRAVEQGRGDQEIGALVELVRNP
ncbi:NAD(P)-binding domain-containing protein [Actinosynnema sp. NPDC020468]|uniref:NAD(P)-dependent oxidoreductase n=1 Tax=Actinosynnema sp. NPDC020468 TaxID=3154488 RepID=UPI00340E4CDA